MIYRRCPTFRPGQLVALTIVALFLLNPPALAADSFDVPVSHGDDIPVERHAADGDTVILWISSDFGTQPPQTVAANALARRGVEVWIADLHAAYFIAPGRYSSTRFRVPDMVKLVDAAIDKGKKNVILATSGRSSRLVLRAARRWQLDNPGKSAVRGFLLFHPSLYLGLPQPGEDGKYLPIVRATNIPVYIFQPEQTANYVRLPDLRDKLAEGGARVYVHSLPQVGFGFHLRPDDMINEHDITARKKLPAQMAAAVKILLAQPRISTASSSSTGTTPKESISRASGLTPYARETTVPEFSLRDLAGNTRRLSDHSGKVVLVNFWTSWCPPCVEEIPSMQRLHRSMKGLPFEILAIDVGEKKVDVRRFLRKTKIDFPVLLDPKGEILKKWKVYVFPTNFLIDTSGRIRYSSLGAVNWDEPGSRAPIARLIKEVKPGSGPVPVADRVQ